MDVRCERCRAQYVFDDEQVTASGLTVQCTNCGHVFKVKKKELVVTVAVKPEEMEGVPLPATAAAPRSGGQRAEPHGGPAAPAVPEPDRRERREWRVRQANGNVFTFRELTSLQMWIVEQKVSRDDEISQSGDQWKRLGNIAELASFFQVVEAAERARAQGAGPAVTPQQMPGFGTNPAQTGRYPLPPSGFPPPSFTVPAPAAPRPPRPPPREPRAPNAGAPAAAVDIDFGEAELAAVKGGGKGRVVAAVFLAIAAGAGLYLFGPFGKKAEPERVGVPITIEVPRPAEPPPDASPAPAPAETAGSDPAVAAPPVHAPEPVPEPVVEPLPEPVVETATPQPPEPLPKAEPVAKAAPTPAPPKGPKALLAQATKLREKGDTERALDLYGRLVAQDPENAEALVGRGLCYLDLSQYPPAEASLQAALEADPGNADALLGLAETYRWQEKNADAIRYYERYLALHPDGEEADVAHNALTELRR